MNETDFIENDFPKLVDGIHESGVDPKKWPEFLGQLSSVFGDAMAIFYLHDLRSNAVPLLLTDNWSPDDLSTYDEHFFAINPYPGLTHKSRQAGDFGMGLQVVSEEDARQSEFYNDWMRPAGWRTDHFGTIVAKDADRISAVVVSPRSQKIDGRAPSTERCFSLLAGHLSRALDLNRLLAGRTLDYLLTGSGAAQGDTACFVLGRDGRLFEANARGRALLRDDPIFRLDQFRCLRCHDSQQDQLLSQEIHEAQTAPAGLPLKIKSGFTDRTYLIWAVPVPPRPSNGSDTHRTDVLATIATQASCVLFISTLESNRKIPAETIQSVFHLTAAESAVASAISAGATPSDYAMSSGLSKHTVRNQLASIHHKLGVRSNAQLVSAIWQKLSVFGAPE